MSQPPVPQPDFKELLTPQDQFSAVVKQAFVSSEVDAPRTDLLFLRFREEKPDVHGLAEIVCNQVVNYALPKRKRQQAYSKLADPADLSMASQLIAEAKRAFISYNASNPSPQSENRYSEIGEVIAFCLASHFLSAGQVAAKMALKTNAQMPVFGLDGIHVRAEPDNTITVFFLESKMVGSAKSGGEQYAASAAGFDQDRKHKLNEQRIARDLSNLDLLEGAMRESALDFFDPYGKKQDSVRERFVGVIIYDEPAYANKMPVTDATPLAAHEQAFVSTYAANHPTVSMELKTALTKAGAEPGRCRAFFLAVPDVSNLKKLFAEAMTGGHIR